MLNFKYQSVCVCVCVCVASGGKILQVWLSDIHSPGKDAIHAIQQ